MHAWTLTHTSSEHLDIAFLLLLLPCNTPLPLYTCRHPLLASVNSRLHRLPSPLPSPSKRCVISHDSHPAASLLPARRSVHTPGVPLRFDVFPLPSLPSLPHTAVQCGRSSSRVPNSLVLHHFLGGGSHHRTRLGISVRLCPCARSERGRLSRVGIDHHYTPLPSAGYRPPPPPPRLRSGRTHQHPYTHEHRRTAELPLLRRKQRGHSNGTVKPSVIQHRP